MGELAALEEAYEGSWFLSKGFQRLLDIMHNGTASPWCATAALHLLLETVTWGSVNGSATSQHPKLKVIC